jgi:hypothetical protein
MRRSFRVSLCRTQAGDENRHDLVAFAAKQFETDSAIGACVFQQSQPEQRLLAFLQCNLELGNEVGRALGSGRL